MIIRRIVRVAAVLVCAVFLGLCGIACGDGQDIKSYENLYVSGIVYFSGRQSVTLAVSNESSATFKESISVKDVTLSDGLQGKTAMSVVYVSSTELELVIDGAVPRGEEITRGKITVSNTAMSNNAYAVAYVNVDYNPKMVISNSYSDAALKTYSCSFILPYGSFIPANATSSNITTAAPATVTAEVTDDVLTVTVTGFELSAEQEFPTVEIARNVTTFDKQLSVTIGGSQFAEYDLT